MYTEKDLVRVAKRENNNKRKYLVVNSRQAKHIPVSPQQAMQMFDCLAELLAGAYTGERLLLIGFAETATAIGVRAAVRLGSLYMQTTREELEGVEYLYFTESHSHATEQKLVKTDLDQVIGELDRVIFIEDEVTTGDTILKIVNLIRSTYEQQVAFSVASLLNGMDDQAVKRYEEQQIRLHYLVKTDHSGYTERAERAKGDGTYVSGLEGHAMPKVTCRTLTNYINARRLTAGAVYQEACDALWGQLREQISSVWAAGSGESVLVLGTEEFMYPAIYIGTCLEREGFAVKCHATTRSPIAVSTEEDYPLRTRYELRSMYDADRTTYVYDISTYDRVLVLTDARNNASNDAGRREISDARDSAGNDTGNSVRNDAGNCTRSDVINDATSGAEAGMHDLCCAIAQNGNSDIYVVGWCHA
ncbi:MAG: phosphoribosyltransferase domain-containing protein [Lachnospiraceae bacterium]|nr:phosphoribosyltransferase domain-containing protein [Lachnospiraceae bacterium]